MAGASFFALSAFLLFGLVFAQDCNGPPNMLPIWEGEPVLVQSVENGRLFQANAQTYNQLNIVHLYGTPYEMGFAQGQLMFNEIHALIPAFISYLESQISNYFQWLPKEFQQIFEEKGIEALLQLTADLTLPYIPQYFIDEMHGLSDALGNASIPYERILQINMFPELIKASCTMFGAWGPAVANTTETLLQLRALDFGIDSPLVNYSVLFVYHPAAGLGHPFASLSWTGLVGSVTSYSGIMGVSEKVWLHYNETASRSGYPFHFLLRDIAQFDNTHEDAYNRMINTRRTCSVFIGLGSNYTKTFRATEYGHELLYFYNDLNYPAYPPAHPLLPGVVYIDKHTQPSQDPCLGSLMQEYYGALSPQVTIQNIVAQFGTGDLHAAVYDFGVNEMYVSVAGVPYTPSGNPILNGTVAPAYSRPWFRFQMTDLFALPL